MLQEFVSIEGSLRSGLSDVIPFFPMNIYKQTTFKSVYFLGFFFFFFYEVFNLMSEVFIFYFFKARLIAGGRGLFCCAIATAVVFLCLIWHSSKNSNFLFVIITDVSNIKCSLC